MSGVNNPLLLLLWGLSNPRIVELCKMSRSFSIKLHSETQVSGSLSMSGGKSPRHAQNAFLGKRRKTLSITHHALSPPPSHHLYIIHLINWLQRFYRITMSLKRPFVPKSDVKQRFTTTTTSFILSIDYNVFIVFQCHLNVHLCRKVTWSNNLPPLLLKTKIWWSNFY